MPGFAAASGHHPGCFPGVEPFSQRCVFAQKWGWCGVQGSPCPPRAPTILDLVPTLGEAKRNRP